MAVTNRKGHILDKGTRVEYVGKSIQGRLGGKQFTDSPEIFDHFARYGYTTYTVTGPIAPDGPFTYTSAGTAVANPTIQGIGGELLLTTDDVQLAAEEFATQLAFEVDTNSPLVFEMRMKTTGA